MKNDFVKRSANGKGYKITKTKDGYWLALFKADALSAFDGWNNRLLRHAKGDGELWVNEGAF